MALLYLRPRQNYWWDTTHPGPDGNGIVHLVKSDRTLPPSQDNPGHSTFCGAVKFPEESQPLPGSILEGQDTRIDDSLDLFNEYELERFPPDETPTSISFSVCDACSSIYDDIMYGEDERGGAGKVEEFAYKSRLDKSKEYQSCLFRVYREDCSAKGVEYRIAETLCSEQRLGEPRQISSFEEIRLNNPTAVFGESLCPACADYYESRLWESVYELPQIEVTVFKDCDEATFDELSRDEQAARKHVEKAVQSNHGSMGDVKEEWKVDEFETTTTVAGETLAMEGGGRVTLTNHLGRSRTFHPAEILHTETVPVIDVIY